MSLKNLNRVKKLAFALVIGVFVGTFVVALPRSSSASEYVVYSVYRPLDMGNPGEKPEKDFYLNMGSAQGLHAGMSVEVSRKASTYDLITEKIYKDITFPIAHLKVIHVENNAAVARLEKILPTEKTPGISPRSVMVGDTVKIP